MFYVEFPFGTQPAFLLDHNSSCVWHDDAIAFRNQRPSPASLWTQNDCEDLIKAASYNIGQVLAMVAACLKGEPIRTGDPGAVAREFHLEGHILAISGSSIQD